MFPASALILIQWTLVPIVLLVFGDHKLWTKMAIGLSTLPLSVQSFMPHLGLVDNAIGGIMQAQPEDTKVEPDAAGQKVGTDDKNTLNTKWGKQTMAVGFTVLPSVLLRSQARLKIKCNELAVLVHLIEHWWTPGTMPWPSKKTLGERLGVSDKTVQRAIVKLEKAKLIQRNSRFLKSSRGRTSNEYDLTLLVERLQEIAEETIKADAEAKTKKWKINNLAAKPNTTANK
jgi:predicted transcriptional regulator